MGINFNEIKIHAHTEQRISLSLEAFHIFDSFITKTCTSL